MVRNIKKVIDQNGRPTFELSRSRLIWTNFQGREGKYNVEGRRNFNVVLEPEDAEFMRNEGFNVKEHEPKNPDDDTLYTLKVNVNFKGFKTPTIWMKNNHGKSKLDENGVNVLDWADIIETWMSFNQHVYQDSKTAYLNTLLVTVRESEYESQFFDEEDSASNTMTFASVKAND